MSDETKPQIIINETALPHSVELAGNSKGKFAPTVKVYSADPMDAGTRALEALEHVRSTLRLRGLLAE